MLHVFQIPLRHRFRGIDYREGVLFEGPAGWAEWSPFLDYHGGELLPWLAAAREAADEGWPVPVRDRIPVNAIIPAVDAVTAHRIAANTCARTVKVKVAERGQTLAEDATRLAAVREAIGVEAAVRIDANGAWDCDEAIRALGQLRGFDLEYVEQPCASVDELAYLRRELARRGWQIPIAADESIRRNGDPERVVAAEAADIAVLKVQPLGGVRRCLELAERLDLPVVVSSAVETAVGLAAGIALAAALPELRYACGLATTSLLSADVVTDPFIPVDGYLPVRSPVVDAERLAECAAPTDRVEFWHARFHQVNQQLPGAKEQP